MNELIITAIILCFIVVVWVGVQVFANICWLIYRMAYNGKMSRSQYVNWFLENRC